MELKKLSDFIASGALCFFQELGLWYKCKHKLISIQGDNLLLFLLYQPLIFAQVRLDVCIIMEQCCFSP